MSKFLSLDTRGVAFVRSQLQDANPLGVRLGHELDLEGGRAYSLVPNSPRGSEYAFEHSIHRGRYAKRYPTEGGYTERVQQTTPDAQRWVQRVFAEQRDLALICESYNLRISDISDDARKDPETASYLCGTTLLQGDYVYHLARATDDFKTMAAVVSEVYTLPVGLGVLFITRRNLLKVEQFSDLSEVELKADDVRALLLAAYDNESIIVWTTADARQLVLI